MYEAVQVRLREGSKISYCTFSGIKLKEGDYVIIEIDRGLDYGQVIASAEVILEDNVAHPLYKIVRKATDNDLRRLKENRRRVKRAYNVCLKRIKAHKLDMKLVEAEYTFDRNRLIFYFISEERVDFRELVKDLARVFKARIELRQIGVRDEAKLFGGCGACGRPLCCAKFLKDFEPVTVRMAKDQGLPLNPTRISGVCGRLMCCLNFEYQSYRSLSKGLPKEGAVVETEEGRGKVISVNVLKRFVRVQLKEDRVVVKKY